MAFFKNKLVIRIKFRLFLVIFLLSTLPLIAIVLYSQRSVFNILVNQSKEYYNSTLYGIVRNFEKNSDNVVSVVKNLTNTQIYSEVAGTNYTNINAEFKKFARLGQLKDSLNEKNIFNNIFLEYYGDIAVVYLNQKSALTGKNRVDLISNRNFIVDYDIFTQQQYFTDMEHSTQEIMLKCIDDGSLIGDGLQSGRVFLIPQYEQSRLTSVVLVVTNDTVWNDLFAEQQKNKNNPFFVVDKYDKIIWSNKSSDNGSIFADIDIRRIMSKLDMSKNQANFRRYFGQTEYDGKKYMIFSDIDLLTGTKFLMLVPITNVTYSVFVFVRFMLIITFVLLAMIIISSLVSSNVFANPIEHQNDTLNQENLYFMNVAHETKTPLTLVINYLDMYILKHGQSEELTIVRDNIEKIKNNMLNFLDIGKIQRGEQYSAKTAVVNISKYLAPKIELYRITAEKKQIHMSFEIVPNIYVKADHFALDRIFDNIVDDAIKYTKSGGEISVRLAACDNQAVIKVKDNGIGIDKKHLKHLFKPYHQVSQFRATTGTGLGLYIIKQLVESLDGTIKADSVKGEGTEFTICLPITAETDNSEDSAKKMLSSGNARQIEILSEAEAASLPNVAAKSDYKILVVEDNDDLRHYLVSMLNRYYIAYPSQNGADALTKLSQIPKPNLIISDVMMDVLNGFDFYDGLQGYPEYKDIPFIFLSALTALPEKLRGLEIGAIDYIAKPFEIEELLAKVKSIINLNELKRVISEKEKYISLGILLGGISHEIFNPLAGIYGPLENLERILEKTGNNNEKSQMFIENIWTNIRRIESIIKSVKSLYTNKDLDKQDTVLHDVADNVINILQTKFKSRMIQIDNRLPKDMSFYTSTSAMSQIFMNLISNAVDAIPAEREDGRITLSLCQTDENVEIRVSDNGLGIPPEKLSTIFDAFYSSKEAGKGMGLGLYIVKDLSMKLNYKIEVESTVGVGTTFRIIIR